MTVGHSMRWKNEGGGALVWRRRKTEFGPEILTLKMNNVSVGTVSKALVASQGYRWHCELPGLPKETQVKGTHLDHEEARKRLIAAVREWMALASVEFIEQEGIAAAV